MIECIVKFPALKRTASVAGQQLVCGSKAPGKPGFENASMGKEGFFNDMYIYIYGTCERPLFWGLNPPKEGLFQSKHWSFGFQVHVDM